MLAAVLPAVATDEGVMSPSYVVPNATFVQQSGETVTTINDTSGSIATVQTAINSARTANASRLIVVNLKANTRYAVTTTPLTLGSNVCLTGSGTTIAADASASATSLVRISAGSRNDPAVMTFAALTRIRDFPTVSRLRAEKELTEDDLYFLGFSLAGGSARGA
jgi:hypothetical protein